MVCWKPASLGFLVTLTAAVILAVVSFCVPYFKTVYFLKASIDTNGQSGDILFGTLGYCVELPGNITCSSPSVGYELDINGLVGTSKFPIEIPQVVVKWLTYVLILHVVAFGLSAISAFLGLLAHFREFSMIYLSSCVSGFAASIALLAFIFDLALFFVAKARINQVQGGSATIGNAIWLTLVAWVLLFFSGCFYAIGRCCGSSRSGRPKRDRTKQGSEYGNGGMPGGYPNEYPDQMRMDAIKAEADRKAREKMNAGSDLPAFPEYVPLKTAYVRGNDVVSEEELAYENNREVSFALANHPTGYAPAERGTRAIDDYNHPRRANSATPSDSYPPQAPTTQAYRDINNNLSSPPVNIPLGGIPVGGLVASSLAAGGLAAAHAHRQQSQPSGDQDYGRTTTYHSAMSQPYVQQESFDPYASQPQHNYGQLNMPHQQSYTDTPHLHNRYEQAGLIAAAGIRPASHQYEPATAQYEQPRSPYHEQQAASYEPAPAHYDLPSSYDEMGTSPYQQPSSPYHRQAPSPYHEQFVSNASEYSPNTYAQHQHQRSFDPYQGQHDQSAMPYDHYQNQTSSPLHQQHQYSEGRSYTLGGGGYGDHDVRNPPPLNTKLAVSPSGPSPVRSPRGLSPVSNIQTGSPPGYDDGLAVHPPGSWETRR